jgi:hypothetical protein
MNLTPALRKLMLTTHVTASVGWCGALAVFLAHAIASVFSRDEQIVRAVSVAMGLTAWFVILPLSLASLVTGLVQALGTAWGLFRHYWVLFKLVLTAVATGVLLLKLGPISRVADAAQEVAYSSASSAGLRVSLLVHAVGGLLMLLAAVALAVYKPRGMTPYGARKARAHGSALAQSGLQAAVRTPRCAQGVAAAIAVVILMLVVMLLGGGHGPGAHG